MAKIVLSMMLIGSCNLVIYTYTNAHGHYDMAAHITTFIVNGEDYFAANLDNGGVRVGLVGGKMIEFPEGHANHAEVAAIKSESEAEEFFDRVFCEYFA